jgi:hypothetical protein
VFISVSVSGLEIIPTSKKHEYTNFIKPLMANPMQPVFVIPSFVYVRVDTTVKYNLNVTSLKPDEIRLLVSNAIIDFNSENLNDFKYTLWFSANCRYRRFTLFYRVK